VEAIADPASVRDVAILENSVDCSGTSIHTQ